MNDPFNAMTVPTMPERFLFLKCRFCTYMTRFTGNLAKHVRTHTGERPYKCMFCTKRFASKSNYNTHITVHASPADGLLHCVAPGCRYGVDRSAAFLRHVKQEHSDLVLEQSDVAGDFSGDASWLEEMNGRHAGEDIKPELYYPDASPQRISGNFAARNRRGFGSSGRNAIGAGNGYRSLASDVASSDMIGSLLQNSLPLMSVDAILSQAMRNVRPRRRPASCHSDTNISSAVATDPSYPRNSFDGDFQGGYFNDIPRDFVGENNEDNDNNADSDVPLVDDLKPTEDELQKYAVSYQSNSRGWSNSNDNLSRSSPRYSQNGARKSGEVSRQLTPQPDIAKLRFHESASKRKDFDRTEARLRAGNSSSAFNEGHLCSKESKFSTKVSVNISGDSEFCQLDDMIDSLGRVNADNESSDKDSRKDSRPNNLRRNVEHDCGNETMESGRGKAADMYSVSGATATVSDDSELQSAPNASSEARKAGHIGSNSFAVSDVTGNCFPSENIGDLLEERIDEKTMSQSVIECSNEEHAKELSCDIVAENSSVRDPCATDGTEEKFPVKHSAGCNALRSKSGETGAEKTSDSVEVRHTNDAGHRENSSVTSAIKRTACFIEEEDGLSCKRVKQDDGISKVMSAIETIDCLAEECNDQRGATKTSKSPSVLNVDEIVEDSSEASPSVMQKYTCRTVCPTDGGKESSQVIDQTGSESSQLIGQMGSESSQLISKTGSESSQLIGQTGSESSRLISQRGSESSQLIGQTGSTANGENSADVALLRRNSASTLSSRNSRDFCHREVQESSHAIEKLTSHIITSSRTANTSSASVSAQGRSSVSGLHSINEAACNSPSLDSLYGSPSTDVQRNNSSSVLARTSPAVNPNSPTISAGICQSRWKEERRTANGAAESRSSSSPDCQIIQESSADEPRIRRKRGTPVDEVRGEQQQQEDPVDRLVREGRLFRCSSCNILTPDYAVFVLHAGCHGAGSEFSCHYCGAGFEERFGFLAHFMRCPHDWSS